MNLIDQAQKYLTDIRLFRYRQYDNPIDTYILNINISEKFISMISIFEIIYRNKINFILSNRLGNDYLTRKELNIFNKDNISQIKRARKKINSNLNVKHSKIITYLTLGFWCEIIQNNKLWCQHLYLLFPKKIRQSNSIRSIISKAKLISKIRNMIAHHERIISKPGINISEIINTISDLTLWLIEEQDNIFREYIKNLFIIKKQEILQLLNNRALIQ